MADGEEGYSGDEGSSMFGGPSLFAGNQNTFMARDLPGAYTGGSGGVEVANSGQDYQQPVPDSGGGSGATAAAAAGGFGALLSLGPQLIQQAKARAIQKKTMKIEAAERMHQHDAALANFNVEQGQDITQYGRAQGGTKAAIDARGMGQSSVKDLALSDLSVQQNARMNAIDRQRVLNNQGFESAEALAKLQKQKMQSDATWGTVSQVAGAVGSAAGAMGGMMSDRSMKTDFKEIDTKTALEKVNSIPVTSWNYKTDPVNRHLGPMAQDWQKIVGGDGRTIDIVTANGLLMAAVQELTKRVRELEARV